MERRIMQHPTRPGRWGGLLGALAWSAATAAAAADGRIDAPAQALVSARSPAGWSVGIDVAVLSRELKAGGDVLEIDANRVVAELGIPVAPFLQLAAQAGWTQADVGDGDGENGLAWAAIARANLAEYVLDASPEIGRREWVGAAVEAQYRSNESNQDTADFDWSEIRIVPNVYYFRNRSGNPLRRDYHASGIGLRGGIVFSGIDADYGGQDAEENRNFGFMLGGDARWSSGWVARIRATVFGSGDHTIDLGTVYHF